MAFCAVALGVEDEVWVAEGEAVVGKFHVCLLPADHAVGVVSEDDDGEV